MLTKHEQRVLYILRKHGGQAQQSIISAAMTRVDAKERERALKSCESLDLISSAKTPATKGRGGTVYWLTSEGIDYVQGSIDAGDMIDPLLQKQGVKQCG